MKINVINKKNELNEETLSTIFGFFNGLADYIEDEIVNIKLSKVKNKYKISARVKYNDVYFKSEGIKRDLYDALEKSYDDLKHDIKQYKKKHNYQTKVKHQDIQEDIPKETAPIISRKRIHIEEMTELEAIKQLEILEHQSFMFFNSNSQSYCMIYKKDKDKYGILIS